MADIDPNELLTVAADTIKNRKDGDGHVKTTKQVTTAVLTPVLEAMGVPGPIAPVAAKVLTPISTPVLAVKAIQKMRAKKGNQGSPPSGLDA